MPCSLALPQVRRRPTLIKMAAAKLLTWGALTFAFLSWVIYIAGIGSLHYACHHGKRCWRAWRDDERTHSCKLSLALLEPATHAPAALAPADLAWADRQKLEQASGMVAHQSCSYTYGCEFGLRSRVLMC